MTFPQHPTAGVDLLMLRCIQTQLKEINFKYRVCWEIIFWLNVVMELPCLLEAETPQVLLTDYWITLLEKE
jgi:hypothetical protein